MGTFRSNFNSVSSTCGLVKFKNRIATCFQHWRHKTILQQQQQNKKSEFHRCFINQESSFGEKTSHTVKEFHLKLKHLFSPKKNLHRLRNKKSQSGDKVQIVAKLLSSTLIATQTTTIKTTTKTVTAKELQNRTESSLFIDNCDTMTISQSSFDVVRDANPDIDKEVRAILISNAQNGVTISQIKDEYRKTTGIYFPIFEHIVEFLLSIPFVTAECNEVGTLIFNIKPSDSNKHIHTMVMNQKQSKEPLKQNDFRLSNGNYLSLRHNYPPERRWRHNNFKTTGKVANTYNNLDQNHNINVNSQATNIPQTRIEKSNREDCYQDNCKYLYNRFNNNQLNSNALNPAVLNIADEIPLIHSDVFAEQQQRSQQLQFHQQHQHVYFETTNARKRKRYNEQVSNGFPPSPSPTATRTSSHSNDSMFTNHSNNGAHILDFPLLGDDFFLYMARMELMCKFKPNEKVLQSGLCISGLSIAAAARRMSRMQGHGQRVIVNIGSVDIMQGKSLIQIEHDFRLLINTMYKRNFMPILTTLAPLANYAHDEVSKSKLEKFNEFIKKEGSVEFFKREGRNLLVIDVYKCMVNNRNQIFFDCYQQEPRFVSGTSEPYVFWNNIGRQRILNMIESELEY